MTVAVPAGCGVVVMANSVHAGGLHNDLVLCRPDTSTIEQIDGNVAVLDGCAQEVSDIRGRFIQTWYGLGGQQSDDGIGYRRTSGIATETLRSIGGGADVDCFNANLICEDLRGAVRVRNVLGATTAIVATHQQGDRLKLQTDSGRICIRLDGQLAEQLRVKLACAAGQVAIPALAKLRKDGRLNNGNDTNLMWFATRGDRWQSALQEDDQDILVVCRDGTITVEPLEAPASPAS